MSDENPMGQVIQIDEARIRDHLGEIVRGTVEETLNAMLDAEADQLCGAGPALRPRPYERRRTAWGRCGLLLLHRVGLAPTTSCRSPGALAHCKRP